MPERQQEAGIDHLDLVVPAHARPGPLDDQLPGEPQLLKRGEEARIVHPPRPGRHLTPEVLPVGGEEARSPDRHPPREFLMSGKGARR